MITGVKEFDCAEQLKAAAEGPPRAKLPQLPSTRQSRRGIFRELENIPGANLLLGHGVQRQRQRHDYRPSAAAAKRKGRRSICLWTAATAAELRSSSNSSLNQESQEDRSEDGGQRRPARRAKSCRTANNKPSASPAVHHVPKETLGISLTTSTPPSPSPTSTRARRSLRRWQPREGGLESSGCGGRRSSGGGRRYHDSD